MRNDQELVAAARSGDGDAFGELVDRYHPRLIRLARTCTSSPEVAEEVAQETWIAVLRGLDGFAGRSTFRTWLFTICMNRARSIAGREHRHVSDELDERAVDPRRFNSSGQWSQPPGDWSDAVDERMVAAELAPHLLAALELLPDGQRQVVTLRDVEGLTSSDVCEVLAISAANQRVLLHRGRSRLRSMVERRLGDG
jgi:RNA polymerase sigma-70 factor, ECF subfamily